MPVTYEQLRKVSADLYEAALKKVPDNTLDALRRAIETETHAVARQTLQLMLRSAEKAEREQKLVCSDSGVPTYVVQVGTAVRMEGDLKRAIRDGFADLVQTISPPILKHVTNPLTNERGYAGKDMPLITWELVDGADWIDVTCSPKALGSGRWAALEIFTYPSLDTIETYVMDCVMKAGSQHCPPVVIGIGIGGSFDHCAKLASKAALRPFGQTNPEPILAAMEDRLLRAVNRTGFGPMGTGGDTTALGVHVEFAAGHGFTPVAVCFNCWINRRTGARLYDDGRVERTE